MDQLQKANVLRSMDFVFISGGNVVLGTDDPLICRLEGVRKNETPVRSFQVNSFWLNKFCVTNEEFENFNPKHHRPPTSLTDNQPVTDLTYMDALTYIEWFSNKHGLEFRLPTESEWVLGAAPFAWEFSYKKEPNPDKNKAHTFSRKNFKTLPVNDEYFGVNHNGLYHMGGNVFEMTQGWYYAPGHLGSETDGAYYIAKGGGFGHCPYSAGVQRRGIFDVTDRPSRVGFRLAHPA